MLWKGSGSFRTLVAFRPSARRGLLRLGVLACCIFSILLISQSVALAQVSQAVRNIDTVATSAGLGRANNLYVIIGNVINVFLSVLGVVFLGYMLFAGYLYTMAGDDPAQVEKALRMIRNAVIGLIIIASAFVLTAFILERLAEVSSGDVENAETGPRASFPSSAGSLGNGIVEYHLPMRDAVNVPRNTAIIVTFTEPIKIASLVQDYLDNGTPALLTDDTATTTLNATTFHIIRRDGTREETLRSDQVDVHFTDDRKTFVFRPRAWLGSPSVNTPYRVEIMPGTSGLLREDGRPAFTSDFPTGYRWQFEVSTVVDLTPPKITSIVPSGGMRAEPPNTIIQINFDEAVDPTSASGIYRSVLGIASGFDNIEVTSGLSTPPDSPFARVEGAWKISNRYQTVEFVPDDICGSNACGRDIHCLPRRGTESAPTESTVKLLAKAASLITVGSPQAVVSSALYNGIVDVCGNSLDGNGNGTAEGPNPISPLLSDNRQAVFRTNGAVDITAPKIFATDPNPGLGVYASDGTGGSSFMPVDHEPKAAFGLWPSHSASADILQASTVNAANVYMTRQNEPREITSDTFWFTSYQIIHQPAAGTDRVVPPPDFGSIAISHRLYARLPSTARVGSLSPTYAPIITSGVQNLLQNCFKPSGSATCAATLEVGTCCNNNPQAVGCLFSHRTP